MIHFGGQYHKDPSYKGTFQQAPLPWDSWYDPFYEVVYSFRTGKHSFSDPIPTTLPLDGWGISVPKNGTSLASTLALRKQYYDEVMSVAFPAETQTGSVSLSRFSTTDSGHLFRKTNVLRQMAAVSGRWWGGEGGNSHYWEGTLPLASNWTPASLSTTGFPNLTGSHLTSVSTLAQRQAVQSRMFSTTAPDRRSAALLVSIIELIRGDVPSIIGNIQKRMSKVDPRLWHGLAADSRYLGGEFLNIQFGWMPLIQDILGALKVLIGLDRIVYAETNRRKRMWDGPSNKTDVSLTMSFGGGAFSTADLYQGPISSKYFAINQADVNRSILIKEDYAFSSRYSSLVKPNSRSNGFVQKAEEILRQVGLVDDPTLLWELLPWSWLVDWVTNIGNDIVNADTYSPQKGKYAIDYAYFTTQLTEHATWDVNKLLPRSNKFNAVVSRPHGFYTTSQRTRERATPFGFGTQLGSISASQFAILVALGMARAR